jgi:hypothetical protein
MGEVLRLGAQMERKQSLEERLREHPELRVRVARLLDVVEDAAGEVTRADEAEQRVAEELQQLGQEALQAWAEEQQARQMAYWEQRAGVNRKEKKDSTGTRALEPSK